MKLPTPKFLIRRRLERTLKPNPGLRVRRMAQMSEKRRERYQQTIDELGTAK